MDDGSLPPGGISYGHLEELLKENLEVAKQNHKILKRMERNALIGFVVKVVVWLIVLGVPIFLLSTYLAPVLDALKQGSTTSTGLFGIPSPAEFGRALEQYRAGR